MKYTNLFFITALVALLGLTGCKKVLDINTDPNKASTATPQLLLPTAQTELGQTIGYTWNYIGSMWAQYWTGGYGVSTSGLEFYNMTSGSTEGSWTRAYARTLQDLTVITKSGQPIYSGMSKIMKAYLFQMLTDLHGAVPFTEANKGAIEDGSILTPSYDSEEDVYAALIPLIDEGLADIATTGATVLEPGDEDLIYGGDLAKWEKFANTLKLKVLVRKGDYTAALALVNSGASFIGAGDAAAMNYYESSQNTNPLYAQFESRTSVGMYYVAAWSSVNEMVKLSDPRVRLIYDLGTAGDSGVYSGDINELTAAYPPPVGTTPNNKFSRPSTFTFDANVPVFFISEWESYFLQAETLVRNDQNADSKFADAVTASFDYYGDAASAPAYIASLNFTGASKDDQLNILGIQKWISMNGLQMIEGWLETLRFDRPGNRIFTEGIFYSPSQNVLGVGSFPSSFLYPTQELTLNPNSPKDRTTTSKRFWDN